MAAKKALPRLVVVALSLALGAMVALNQQIAVVLLATVLGALAISAPAGAWALCAVVAALTFKGLATLGFPSVATFLDIPLAWGALAAALLRRRAWSPPARRHLSLLAGLAVAVLLAWIAHPSEPARALLYLLLLGEPFALLGALWVDPPSPGLRRALVITAGLLLAVQIPVAFWQAQHVGRGDNIQGTLYGAGAGAHTISAVIVVGALWLAARGRRLSIWRLALPATLLVIPFLADAKQVIFALPAGLIALQWPRRRIGWAFRAGILAASIFALISLNPFGSSGKAAGIFLERAASGQAGKLAVAELIGDELTTDSPSLLFGKGPAETVSRAAFMTTDRFLDEDSPLRLFGLRPAAIALEAESRAARQSEGYLPGFNTSFNSGVSSALGVLGDLGSVGMLVYVALLASVFLALRRHSSAEATAARVGWAMFAVLGLIFDWWEQPPFSLFLALLTGLAVTQPRRPSRPTGSDARAPHARLRRAPPVAAH